jgi:hypothetical protein
MFLLGCILAIGISIAPRLMLLLAWIFSERWDIVWQGNWFWPLMGILFAPFTTIMYLLVWSPLGVQGWDWMWIIMGVLLDIMKWSQVVNNRKYVPGYPQADTGVGTTPTAPVA